MLLKLLQGDLEVPPKVSAARKALLLHKVQSLKPHTTLVLDKALESKSEPDNLFQ